MTPRPLTVVLVLLLFPVVVHYTGKKLAKCAWAVRIASE